MPSQYKGSKVGFPIRRSLDQSSFAAPQGLSQRTTSFIASQRQGIHQMLLRHLITLMIDVRSARPDNNPRKTCLRSFQIKDIACRTHPALTAAGRGWFSRTRLPRLPNVFPLYDVKHPRRVHRTQHESSFRLFRTNGGARRDRTDDLLNANQALSQLSYGPLLGIDTRGPRGRRQGRLAAAPHGARSQGNGRSRRRLRPMTMVGLGRLERPTSPLSGVRSNHLSYRP
jgi:hypothetical protein